MADIVITPANVLPGANASVRTDALARATILAGQVVYYDNVTAGWKLALANGTAVQSGNGTSYGIALNNASPGQPLGVATADSAGLTIGGTTAIGTVYCVSTTPGGIAPWADLIATNLVTLIGVGQTGNKIQVITNASGILHA